MSTPNRISAVLSAADVTAVQAAIATIKAKPPFLITLQPSDRVGLRKMGQKREGYFQDVSNGVNAFPNAMPANFPTAEYLKDSTLMAAFMQVAPQLLGLASNIDDTLLQLGSELVANTDLAYGYLKSAAKVDSTVKPTVEKIASGLKQNKAGKKAAKPA